MAFRHELADFEGFYERTYPSAYRTALGIVRDPTVAADVTQDAYVRAFRERARFRGDAPVTAWLHRIVVNAALDGLRRRARGPREIEIGVARDVSADLGAVGGLADRLALVDAMGILAPRSRAAIVLRYYHGYDYATIGRFLGTSPGNVGVLLTRALETLRLELERRPEAAAAGPRRAGTEVSDER